MLTIICITVTGLFAYYFAARVMERNSLQMSQDTLNKTAQVLDERLRNVIVATSTFMMGDAFQRAMIDVLAGHGGSYFNHLSALQTPFSQMKLNELSIDSMLIHTPIGDFYPTDRARRPVSVAESRVLQEAMAAEEPWNTLWIAGHQEELFSRSHPVITLVMKPLFDVMLPDVYIVVNIREDAIRGLLTDNLDNQQIEQVLMTGSGEPVLLGQEASVYRLGEKDLQELSVKDRGNFEYTDSSGHAILSNYATLSMHPVWKLVSFQDKAELLAPMKNILWFILMIMGGCIVLAFVFSNLLSGLLLQPLYKLRSLMLRVEQNNLDVRFESNYDDEVTQVGYKFNRMLEQIGTLIDEVKLSETEKRKSEIKALQAQIDPHFLYNTLNTIFWKSEMGEHETVKEMIVSLSMLFRLGLNNGNEITTIGQELEHVEQYMNLQQKSYQGLFVYDIQLADEGLRQLPILKIILQPLVENAINHGFQEMSGRGLIVIRMEATEELLIIRVTDNGTGMDVEDVRRRMAMTGRAKDSYALSNVESRLALYYGDQASMELESEPNMATTVTLRIPLDAGY
ncbi:sensor histidine kinase [Paenibacillus daejeonensis]|uniref:sensor histidine kinase n=1 Tax=Paenibacillus daejeonensis TaxID=135193 RepID=UPI001FDFED5B|nr:sensor histidine kinase [Paenibacillus daejeonensis]